MCLRVAIVGCGKIADGHVEEIGKMPHKARVVAVCDRELLMAEQLAVRYGLPAHYDDMDTMLEREKPDVVHIATPPGAHLELATRAMDAGCHVYVEKPLTLRYADSARLVEKAELTERKLTVGYSYLFDPPAERMRELVASGVVGDPVHVECYYGYNISGAFGSAITADAGHWVHRLPGRLFHNNIDHVLNRMTEFIPDDHPMIQASAYARTRTDSAKSSAGAPPMQDELRLMLSGSGVSAYGTLSCNARPVGHFTRLYGTRKTLHVDYIARTVVIEPEANLPGPIGRLVPAFSRGVQELKSGLRNTIRFARSDFQYFAGLSQLLHRYYDSIAHDAAPPIAYRDILRISRFMDCIFEQIECGAVYA